jgi:hypothetical protein
MFFGLLVGEPVTGDLATCGLPVCAAIHVLAEKACWQGMYVAVLCGLAVVPYIKCML